ncbi:hypothetical protein, partial [Paenibacillus zanthoxyli]|uniref:hypothetical protein n=1 Tax=Paenibacillus zanthoxyli TaxID=369399 RepID=UPI001E4A9293
LPHPLHPQPQPDNRFTFGAAVSSAMAAQLRKERMSRHTADSIIGIAPYGRTANWRLPPVDARSPKYALSKNTEPRG